MSGFLWVALGGMIPYIQRIIKSLVAAHLTTKKTPGFGEKRIVPHESSWISRRSQKKEGCERVRVFQRCVGACNHFIGIFLQLPVFFSR